MSLIIAGRIETGIVVAADSRHVCEGRDGPVLTDEEITIVPFPNRTVVAYCGDNTIDRKPAHEFLLSCRSEFGAECTIHDLPQRLLSAHDEGSYRTNTVLVIAGCKRHGPGAIYTLSMKRRTIEMLNTAYGYGFVSYGYNDVARKMFDDVKHQHMTISECRTLINAVMEASTLAYQYRPKAFVGGECGMYVISPFENKTGWFRDGVIVPDENASDHALDKFLEEKRNRYMAEYRAKKAKEAEADNGQGEEPVS